ncbi:HAD-IIA family hydrolase [Haloarchaeobius iranensis]|uniref:Haloacid Dehalogenase Superfamily Class (Subfamily) IIA n=1 Tax=Haloarchaeobius iranensis TaxID=996166 RepID=A0A1H0C2T9_9EURY|nr:HAD-IIA family hydrolase [Haloarchaeobius iranensis]SDN52117.1 Haloacid Dehalogenase Superfamily Class (subfamily) IIA [Haloarchaeobius iranensis]
MIADQFETFLFDLDGVIYLGNEALPDAVNSVNRLHEQDKQIRFFTNDPRPTRDAVASRLRALGIEADEEEIVTAAWAAAAHLRQEGITKAAAVGSEGLRTEIRQQGITVTDESPEAVVVGADEQTSYTDIRRATRHIDDGARFIGTNPDGAFPTPNGPVPGAGAIVRAVETAARTSPTVVGKPEPLMFEVALEGTSGDQDGVVIGDNPATDILGAHRAGLTGILVADEAPTAASRRDFTHPDAVIQSLADLFSHTVTSWTDPQYSWPEDIRPGVGAVASNGSGEVLLLKRADKEQWALPTGTVERGESVEEAISREMREETGLHITVERLTGVYSHPEQQVFSYPSGETVHFVTNCFLCSVDGGTLEADQDEALEVGFFDTDRLPSQILSMHPRWIADAVEGTGVSVR